MWDRTAGVLYYQQMLDMMASPAQQPRLFSIVCLEWPQIDKGIAQSKNRPGGDFLIGVSTSTLESELAYFGCLFL